MSSDPNIPPTEVPAAEPLDVQKDPADGADVPPDPADPTTSITAATEENNREKVATVPDGKPQREDLKQAPGEGGGAYAIPAA